MGIVLSWKNVNYMLEIDILRNYFPKYFGDLKGDFGEFGGKKMPRHLAG